MFHNFSAFAPFCEGHLSHRDRVLEVHPSGLSTSASPPFIIIRIHCHYITLCQYIKQAYITLIIRTINYVSFNKDAIKTFDIIKIPPSGESRRGVLVSVVLSLKA